MEGARVTAVVGATARGAGLAQLGAAEVVTEMPADGHFDVILESVGGESLAASLRLVAAGGTVALFGNSSGQATTFQAADFFFRHATKLYGYLIFPELEKTRRGADDLGHLAALMADGKLDPSIDVTAPWSEATSRLPRPARPPRRRQGRAHRRLTREGLRGAERRWRSCTLPVLAWREPLTGRQGPSRGRKRGRRPTTGVGRRRGRCRSGGRRSR